MRDRDEVDANDLFEAVTYVAMLCSEELEAKSNDDLRALAKSATNEADQNFKDLLAAKILRSRGALS